MGLAPAWGTVAGLHPLNRTSGIEVQGGGWLVSDEIDGATRALGPGRVLGRRRFLVAGSALSVGILSGWACAPADSGDSAEGDDTSSPGADPSSGEAGGAETGSAEADAQDDPDGLPPRVVGLRSLGGAFRFDPVGLMVGVGAEVHWLNMGDFHTVTAFHPDNAQLLPSPVPLRIPEGAASFHSGMLGLTAGTQFSHRFDVEGVYDYFCQPHYSFGMVGRIIVGSPVDGPALNRPEDDLIETARAQMPSVEAITGPSGAGFEWAARINGILYRMANGGEGAPAAETVATRAMSDDALTSWLDADRRGALEAALSDLVTEANGSAGYEAVLRQADAAKKVLREASAAA